MKILYTFFFLLLFAKIYGQTTFNKKYYLKYNVAIFSNLDIQNNRIKKIGVYLIQFLEKNKLLKTEQFVKQ